LRRTASARYQGRWRLEGRPASINTAQVREMKSQGVGATEIRKALGIDRATV
jgi:DNA invertase Pin-like site-specific DNA recombinase